MLSLPASCVNEDRRRIASRLGERAPPATSRVNKNISTPPAAQDSACGELLIELQKRAICWRMPKVLRTEHRCRISMLYGA
jgi:hypothetical protein